MSHREPRKCFMTLTAGGLCPGFLGPSGIPSMDQCSYCGTWVGNSEPPDPLLTSILFPDRPRPRSDE